ncbi:putative Phospholipid-transporting ATPase 1 [Cocos nucifera]|nr:putative Phospholipid-transporting ATPase 1 [Cocos nucifera]
MELQGLPTRPEVFTTSTRQDIFSKSQRIRRKSVQLEDSFMSDENSRVIYINDPRGTNDKYEFSGNEIRTSKYTVITFLPKNLFIQFHRVAYLYFLAIAALNQLPPLAVFGRTVSLFPLLFVLSVTAIKDGYEDWRRHRSDQKENNRQAQVFQSDCFQAKKWKNMRAGEVVRIHSNETIPCDIVLLGTSDPSGVAYVLTMNLDGESNLKTRYARQETTFMDWEHGPFTGSIRCEQPNRNIYEFTANMEFNGQRIPLGQSNIVLRGCQLKNTDWIVGVVVYAVVAIGMGLWLKRHGNQLDTLPYYRRRYFTNGRDNGKKYRYYGIPMETVVSFFSSVIVFQIMIPISLYITMELVRLGQSYFMIGDAQMYDSGSGSRFQCRSLNINEDLGQIRYVFSDKTGTLTENKMEFRRASVYGKDYGNLRKTSQSLQEISISGGPRWKRSSEISVDPELLALLHKDLVGEEQIAVHEFFLTLSACNTVIPIASRSPSSSANDLHDEIEAIDYQGESPDEQALVAAASAYGYTLIERTSGHIVIDVNGDRLRLEVLGLHEFDSVRKRMSVVIRFPNGAVKVFVKGADSSMLSVLDELNGHGHKGDESTKVRHATENHLTDYSSQGLRTLVIAARGLSDGEFEGWQIKYEEASTSLSERSAKLRQAAALIECNLSLLGATAIEDKLQDGVPETIESLRQAGIKVWVLTGDKQETAISIGLSCKLLTQDMHQIIINGASERECSSLLADAMAKYGVKSTNCASKALKSKKKFNNDYLETPDDTKTSRDLIANRGSQALGSNVAVSDMTGSCGEILTSLANAPLALIIDGNSLVYILEKDLETELFDLATACRVVLCCRVAPFQKAGIVDLVKNRTSDMTLAIGDGE